MSRVRRYVDENVMTRRQWLGGAGIAISAVAFRVGSESHAQQVVPSAARPATKKSTEISDTVREIHSKHQAPGLVGAIVDREGLVAAGAAGVRSINAGGAMTVRDKIHIGSCTKAMTATLIGQLIEAQQLRLDSTVRDVFSATVPQMASTTAAITVANLLDHTSGLPANVDWWSFDRSGGPLPTQRLNVAKSVLSTPTQHPPGSKYVYSNVGYMLLGAMIEAITRQPWEDIVTAKLFRPLGMASAGFGAPGTKGHVDQPWGHLSKGSRLEPVQFDNAPVLGPAGRVHCSIGDWAKYVQWCLRSEQENSRILTAAMQKRMLAQASNSEYAGGWNITQRAWAGGRTLTHSGSNTTWFCVAWLAPLKGFGVLAATNVAGADASKACDDLSGALIARHDALKSKKPK